MMRHPADSFPREFRAAGARIGIGDSSASAALPAAGTRYAGDFGNLLVHLAQRRDVVENPERAAVGGDNQVVAMNRQIAHGSVRQIQLQRLPGIGVIKGNVDRGFRAGKKQALPARDLRERR